MCLSFFFFFFCWPSYFFVLLWSPFEGPVWFVAICCSEFHLRKSFYNQMLVLITDEGLIWLPCSAMEETIAILERFFLKKAPWDMDHRCCLLVLLLNTLGIEWRWITAGRRIVMVLAHPRTFFLGNRPHLPSKLWALHLNLWTQNDFSISFLECLYDKSPTHLIIVICTFI